MAHQRDTTRRAFLGSAVAAAASTGHAAAKTILVAAHPWVYAAPLPKYDITPVLGQIFADMSYAGVDGIELMDVALRPPDAVERIGELSRRHELRVIGTSYSAKMWDRSQQSAVVEDAHLVIERIGKLGGRTLGVSVGDKRERKTPEELDAQAEVLRKILPICRANGVVLNLHNHVYEVRDGEYDLNGTLARIPDIKLGPDLAWLYRAGVDPVDFIRRHPKSIVFAHIRDEKRDHTWPEGLGEGDMDFPGIGRALHDIGFAGDLSIELAHEKGFQLTRPLRETLKRSREYVRRVVGY